MDKNVQQGVKEPGVEEEEKNQQGRNSSECLT
jgi:hypothetical protein